MSFYMVIPSNSCEQTQPNNTASNFVVDWNTSINFLGKWKVALTEYAIQLPNRTETYKTFYIYSSITKPILVGNVYVPLLRQIWINDDDRATMHDTMDPLMYIPISCQSINNIEIQIRDDAGKLIEFPKGTKTSLILHFEEIE
jgi:hypothetical protein